MYASKLHTRQLRCARSTLMTMAALGPAALWCSGIGSGIARADNNHEQEACALMDDHASAIHLGYSSTPVQYAMAVLSTEMPPVDAAHTLLAATHDYCPGHAGDLPDGWR